MSNERAILCLALLVSALGSGCGKSKKLEQCEILERRVIGMSAGIAENLQKWQPQHQRVDRATMERKMRARLDEGGFIDECMKLDPNEVECLATASTKQEWIECGFDQQMLP